MNGHKLIKATAFPSLTCKLCHKPYDLCSELTRPVLVSCGHSFCKNCWMESDYPGNCPLPDCKQLLSDIRGKNNYQLESQLNKLAQFEQRAVADLKNAKPFLACLECKQICEGDSQEELDRIHSAHETIGLNQLSKDQLKEFLWYFDLVCRGSDCIQKFECILEPLLAICFEFQQRLTSYSKPIEIQSRPLSMPELLQQKRKLEHMAMLTRIQNSMAEVLEKSTFTIGFNKIEPSLLIDLNESVPKWLSENQRVPRSGMMQSQILARVRKVANPRTTIAPTLPSKSALNRPLQQVPRPLPIRETLVITAPKPTQRSLGKPKLPETTESDSDSTS